MFAKNSSLFSEAFRTNLRIISLCNGIYNTLIENGSLCLYIYWCIYFTIYNILWLELK